MMMTTLRYSLIAIGCNIVLNLILMWHLKQGGIALSTVLASMLNNTLLLRHLQKEGIPARQPQHHPDLRPLARRRACRPGRCFTGSTRCSASG